MALSEPEPIKAKEKRKFGSRLKNLAKSVIGATTDGMKPLIPMADFMEKNRDKPIQEIT